MMKKIFTTMVAIVMTMSVFTGCGQSATTESTTTVETDTTESTTTAETVYTEAKAKMLETAINNKTSGMYNGVYVTSIVLVAEDGQGFNVSTVIGSTKMTSAEMSYAASLDASTARKLQNQAQETAENVLSAFTENGYNANVICIITGSDAEEVIFLGTASNY